MTLRRQQETTNQRDATYVSCTHLFSPSSLIRADISKPEGFIRIPARGETRWSSLYRELTKFCEMFPFLDVAVRSYSDHNDEHGAVPGFDKLEEWFSTRECRVYTLLCGLLKPIAEVLKILEGSYSCLNTPSL